MIDLESFLITDEYEEAQEKFSPTGIAAGAIAGAAAVSYAGFRIANAIHDRQTAKMIDKHKKKNMLMLLRRSLVSSPQRSRRNLRQKSCLF